MTTEELLWSSRFECEDSKNNDLDDYLEERQMENYYEDKELFERFDEFIKTAS